MNLEAPNQYWSFQANEVFPAENDQQIVFRILTYSFEVLLSNELKEGNWTGIVLSKERKPIDLY